MAMAGCKKCGQTFMSKDKMNGHICEKIEQGTATVKKADLVKKGKK